MRRLLPLLLLLSACGSKEGPLGIPLGPHGKIFAGAAVVDITPELGETFTDLNHDGTFEGCIDDPTASRPECDEPFDDANGDGQFEPVWIGGYGPMRPMLGVHDPISTRAFVLSDNGQYIAFVSIDVVGLAKPRIHAAKDALAADGFDPDRLVAAATHNHQGPDTMGLWGDPYDFQNPVTGLSEPYQERVSASIEQAVRDAASHMVEVDLTVGSVHTRDLSPWYNGANWGGKSPDPKQLGMDNDIRDPVVPSDQVLVLQATGEGGVVFTWTNWSGHPEVVGGSNNLISADWVGYERDAIEGRYGGIAIHTPECLGGMQSALGGAMPLVDDQGNWVYQTCDATAVADPTDAECFGKTVGDVRVDGDGDQVPEWAERETFDFARSNGWHIADAADYALNHGKSAQADPIRVEVEPIYVPIDNIAYQILGSQGIFDLNTQEAITDTSLCPEDSDGMTGCIDTQTERVQVGPMGFVGVPGELLPELFWGLPSSDAEWQTESTDPTARGDGSLYFPQHDHHCDSLQYSQCTTQLSVGDCDCLSVHAWPYTLNADPAVPPMASYLDTPYKAGLSMVDNYMSYVIPEPDFNTRVSLLSDRDGDHYEDTVSPSKAFATRIQQAQERISQRW